MLHYGRKCIVFVAKKIFLLVITSYVSLFCILFMSFCLILGKSYPPTSLLLLAISGIDIDCIAICDVVVNSSTEELECIFRKYMLVLKAALKNTTQMSCGTGYSNVV